jgi:pSer/pThr/pTyr-binding forkhead associated (FHA) protein
MAIINVKVQHVSGSKSGTAETFQTPMISVGRDPMNVLRFDPAKDMSVSSRHAQITYSDDVGFIITDLGSSNGTFLNGQKLTGPTVLQSGSMVQFGENGPQVMITCEAAPEPEPTPPPPPQPVVPAGPSKTRMMVAQMEESGKKTKKLLVFLIIFIVILIGAGIGYAVYRSLWKKPKEAALLVKSSMEESRDEALVKKANELTAEDYKKAEEKENSAAELFKKGEYDQAKLAYREAKELYKEATRKAEDEAKRLAKEEAERKLAEERRLFMAQISRLQADAQKQKEAWAEKLRQMQEEERKKLEELRAEQDRKRAEEAKKIKELEEKLKKDEASKKALEEAEKLKNQITDLQSRLDGMVEAERRKAQEKLDRLMGDLKAKEATLPKDILDELNALKARMSESETFKTIFAENENSIVYIRSETYIQPGGPETKAIIAMGHGTGYFVRPGVLITAKEVIQPWKYDPKMMGLYEKVKELTEEKEIKTSISVWIRKAGQFQKAFSTDDQNLEVKGIARDAFADEAVKTTFIWDGKEIEKDVKPHVQDYHNLASLTVKGEAPSPLKIDEEPSYQKLAPVLVAGCLPGTTPEGKPKVEVEPSRGGIIKVGGLVEVNAITFQGMLGSPVFNIDGKVIGIVSAGSENKIDFIKIDRALKLLD